MYLCQNKTSYTLILHEAFTFKETDFYEYIESLSFHYDQMK
jgi:hypothetical protein